MNRFVSPFGIALLVLAPMGLGAQQIQVPARLVGKWGRISERPPVACSPKNLDEGVEITADGNINVKAVPPDISSEAIRHSCKITQFEPYAKLANRAFYLGAWRYVSDCETTMGDRVQTTERRGIISLMLGSPDREKTPAPAPTPTLVWSEVTISGLENPETVVFLSGEFERCP